MAQAATDKPTLTLSEQYLLKQKGEKPDVDLKPTEASEEGNPVDAGPEEVAAEKTEETSEAVSEVKTDGSPAASEESTETNPASAEDNSDAVPSPAGESNETTEKEQSGDVEVSEEEPEIKLATAPADFRFPTTNQTRHCFTRYIEYHRCTAAKGEGAQECDRFAKYYRALCPGEWIERWNEQRENGTFPGPL
uniref:Uncharacterized protein MANES_02G149600 n=1 Tax=Rhizophora mucronata TaxID=61149 RepID=A0A2P2JQA8_RHIMU